MRECLREIDVTAYAAAMPDYRKLAYYLGRHPEPRIRLSFEQIEAIIGGALPAHARGMTDWWTGNNIGQRHHDAPWHALGWHLERLDSYRGAVTFVKSSSATESPLLFT